MTHNDAPTNFDRVEWAEACLNLLGTLSGTGSDSALSDLLGHLHHWADQATVDWTAVLADSHRVYLEQSGDAPAPTAPPQGDGGQVPLVERLDLWEVMLYDRDIDTSMPQETFGSQELAQMWMDEQITQADPEDETYPGETADRWRIEHITATMSLPAADTYFQRWVDIPNDPALPVSKVNKMKTRGFPGMAEWRPLPGNVEVDRSEAGGAVRIKVGSWSGDKALAKAKLREMVAAACADRDARAGILAQVKAGTTIGNVGNRWMRVTPYGPGAPGWRDEHDRLHDDHMVRWSTLARLAEKLDHKAN